MENDKRRPRRLASCLDWVRGKDSALYRRYCAVLAYSPEQQAAFSADIREYLERTSDAHCDTLSAVEIRVLVLRHLGYPRPEIAGMVDLLERDIDRLIQSFKLTVLEPAGLNTPDRMIIQWVYRHLDCCLPGSRQILRETPDYWSRPRD
ncbi:MAG: hypothetical protein ACSLFM_12940 [Tepidiformaceae bacterium]